MSTSENVVALAGIDKQSSVAKRADILVVTVHLQSDFGRLQAGKSGNRQPSALDMTSLIAADIAIAQLLPWHETEALRLA